jgi:hypothetical protein
MRDGEKKIASLTQLPLRLAWAITIHKSQGMTLDGAHIDLGRAFVPGMGYVALSRVKNLKSLTLGGLNRTALMMHEDAHMLDEGLRRQSATDTTRHKHLEEEYEKKQHKQRKVKEAKTASGGDWKDRLEKMRSEHPNAYKPWKKIEDETLLNQWAAGKKVKELASLLGRHDGSIRARLKKHLGEDLFTK